MKTFFFYDLETSGFNPRQDRIMQFAGQRTDMNLNKIGDPVNILIRLNDDVLPSPNALMVTKISPQKTVEEGYSEAEFTKMCLEEFFTPDTIAVGYNNIRFDDEHMRYLFWRNFCDPYQWQWQDGRSRWDFLDVVRMVRALRPDGINWPTVENEAGEIVASNKLELLTKINGIEHENAHDAMSDVDGLIGIARLLKEKQPKMFEYLLKMRNKSEVQNLVNLDSPQLFVYTSGRFDAEFDKTTVAFPIAPAPNRNVLVWDARFSPEPFVDWTAQQISENLNADWQRRQEADFVPLPVKVLQYNRCPAVAPVSVLRKDDCARLKINLELSQKHVEILHKNQHLIDNLRSAFEDRSKIYNENNQDEFVPAEARLYEGFLSDSDRLKVETIRNANLRQLADYHPEFTDERLPDLLVNYKARNFPKSLSADEKLKWEEYRSRQIQKMLPKFIEDMNRLSIEQDLTDEQKFILEELHLWLENILPDQG